MISKSLNKKYAFKNNWTNFFNPFHATGLFLYNLKISENLWFSDIFREYRKRPVALNYLYISVAQRCSVIKMFIEISQKFTRKHLCQGLFFNKVSGLGSATLLKKRLWHWWTPVNFAKFLRTLFLKEFLRWLLLIFTLIDQRVLSRVFALFVLPFEVKESWLLGLRSFLIQIYIEM